MSVRITLSDFEAEYVVLGLKKLRDETYMSYPVVNVGKHFYDNIISKHRAYPPLRN